MYKGEKKYAYKDSLKLKKITITLMRLQLNGYNNLRQSLNSKRSFPFIFKYSSSNVH